jgi:hypothetical protein
MLFDVDRVAAERQEALRRAAEQRRTRAAVRRRRRRPRAEGRWGGRAVGHTASRRRPPWVKLTMTPRKA